ncbi:MAG: MFS transporter, partial [Litorilinea sp.]
MKNALRDSMLLPVYVPTMVLAFGTGMLVPILPLYARSFDISYALIGVVLASQGIGNLIGDIPAGVLLGRLGEKRAMLFGVLLLGLATTAKGFAQSVPELVIYGFAAGVGNALWNISRHAYITSVTQLHQRGRANATFGGIGRIGTFAGPFVGGVVAASLGLRFPFFVFGAITLLAFAVSALFIVEVKSEQIAHRGGMRGHSRHLVGLFRTHARILTTAGIGQLCAQMIRSGRTVIIPLYAADVVGLDVNAIGLVVTLAAAVDMAMFYPAGLIMDRFGRKYAMVPSFIIQALGMALIPFTATFGGLVAASMIVGFGNGIGSGTMLTLGADLAPKESMGEFLGMWRLIGDSGSSGAPLVVGSIADVVGLSPATWVIALVGLAAAGILAKMVPETLRARDPVVEVKP